MPSPKRSAVPGIVLRISEALLGELVNGAAGKILWLTLIAAIGLLTSVAARGQDEGLASRPTSRPGPGHGPGRGHGPPGFAPGRHRGGDFAHSLFGIGPDDEGPLQPGEEEQLMDFARSHTPRLYRAMQWLREHNPDKFQQRLTEHAPRLRHLRRVYERNPKIGTIIQTYAENTFEIERGAMALRRAEKESPGYECDVQAVRDLMAENVRLEADALEALAAEMEQEREQRVEKHVAYLTSADADVSAAPDNLREAVAAYRAATNDAERAAQRAAIRTLVEQQLKVEVAALRERIGHMRDQAAEQVDSRMQRLLEFRPPRGDRTDDGHRGRGSRE